ncbi:trimeric intracellular cation channel family protein [Leptobacterium flavescens]|uniref:Trimeric intracellular cation channel family protein n=1 Tax=Leptobacterium flavescens TaxID=472055 RepID=A0A6P0UL49_9FLAO|nr:trimeric intracellular cation channel family protein [Leptobacterium flavescens]NER14091.1 trimeric intracellular cation channel family protein [Leptobacterium flavescens]
MLFYSLDIIGTFAFAISGFLTALNKRLDPFGLFIVAFVTALGGGTLRDILIGRTPVGWMIDLNYVYIVIAGVFFAVLFRRKLNYLRTSLFLFDTVGLGVFTIIGVEKGIDANLHPIISIALGTMSASFGGVIRDILCNEIPVIFRKEIYATACIAGGAFFFILKETPLNDDWIYVITTGIVILIRLLAVRYQLKLPLIQS